MNVLGIVFEVLARENPPKGHGCAFVVDREYNRHVVRGVRTDIAVSKQAILKFGDLLPRNVRPLDTTPRLKVRDLRSPLSSNCTAVRGIGRPNRRVRRPLRVTTSPKRNAQRGSRNHSSSDRSNPISIHERTVAPRSDTPATTPLPRGHKRKP